MYKLEISFASLDALAAFVASQQGGTPTTVVVNNAETSETATPDVDKNGLPWDERIHSPSKAINADGSWRGKKGVSAEVKAQVTAELQAGANITQTPEDRNPPQMPPQMPAQPQPPQMPPQMPAQQPMQPPAQPPQPPQQPMQPPAPTQPEPSAQPQAPADLDFNGFMTALAPLMQNGSVTTEYIGTMTGEIANAFNTQLAALTDIANNPQMITYAVQCLQRDGKWAQ